MSQNDAPLTQLQATQQRLQSLLRVSSSFATAVRPQEVYETVIAEGKATLGAIAGAVTLVERETLTIVAFQGHDPDAIATLKQQPITANYPVAEAIRNKEPLFFHTATERLQRYPHLSALFNPKTNASAYLPLLLGDEAIGALTLSFPDEQSFDAATRDFLEMLTNTCAQTLHRALLFEGTNTSEQRFRGLFENTLDAILIADKEGQISAVNSSAETLFGYNQNEFLSLVVPDLFAENERERLANIRGQENHYDEWLLLCKDGTERWAEMSCQSFPDGHSQAVIRDITSRKKAEVESQLLTRELETEKTILDTILRTAPVGFTFFTKDLRYSHTNEALADINGVPAAQHLGRTLYDIVPDLAPKIEETFRGVLETGESVSLELKGETPKYPGVTRYWHENIYRVQNTSGETLGLGVMVQEITERKREDLNAQLLLELSAATRFLSNPDDIEYCVIKTLGEYLEAKNCTFAKVNLSERTVVVSQQWNMSGAKDLIGTYGLEDFVLPELMIEYQSGLTVAIDDVARDLRTSPYKNNFAALGIATLVVPYLEEGIWTGTLTVSCSTPHEWRKDEVALIETILKQFYPPLKRLRTETALRESETQFRTLAETLPGFVWMDSEGGTNLYMNPRWEEFTGQSVEAARAGGWHEVTHPDDLPRIAQRWAWSRKTGEAYEMELRHRHKNGDYHWFLAKGLPVRDSEDNITRWVGTSIDIQEQKETLEALQESETRFRELANGLPQFIWTLRDDKNRLEYINEPWLTYTGQTLAQALTNANDAIHPDDLPHTLSLWQRSFAENSSYESELRIRSKTGEYRWFLARTVPIKDETGDVKRWVGTSTDIHERKLAEFDAGFLLMLSTRLSQLESSEEIEETITRLLGEYLEVDRCYNGTIDAEQDRFTVAFDWHKDGLGSIVGSYPLFELTTASFLERLSSGEAFVVEDIRTDPRTARFAKNFRFTQAQLFIPQLERDSVTALFGVACTTPRIWQAHEVGLVETIARQFWPAVSRAKAEENLRVSEERYRTLFTSIDEGFCIVEMLFDEHGKPYDYCFLEINPMFEKQTGLVNAVGKTALELVPNLEPHWFEIYGRVATTGESVRFNDESRAMDGRWFEVYASRVGDENSRRVAIVFNNITGRKRAELALRESEEKLRMMVESASEYAIITTDLAGHVTSWNTGATRVLGYEEQDILGKNASIIFTPEDVVAETPEGEMQIALQTGRAADERWHVRKDGSHFWATGVMMPLRDEAGALQGFLKIMRDRTRERAAEEALEESEARLSLTVQAGNLGIWDSDLINKRTYWSPEQEKLFGLAPGDFDGSFSKHVHPEDRTRVLRRIAEIKATGQHYQDEFRVVHPDGSVHWLAGRGRVLRNKSGQATRLIGVNFDITERKRRELNTRFLLELNTTVRTLSSGDDIERTVMNALASYLNVTNCNISYVDEAANRLEVRYNGGRGNIRLEGNYTISDYVAPEFIRYYKQGESMAVADVTKDSRITTRLDNIVALELRSLLVVPYLKEKRWVAALNISCDAPREWRKDEQELAETVAAQFIPAIERARSEETAALLAERFRLTEISAKSFLYEWDLVTNQVWRSQGLEAVTGFADEEVSHNAQWWRSRIHPEDLEKTRAIGAEALTRGGEYSLEYRVRNKDGDYIYLWDRGRATLNTDGKALKLLGTSTDVTVQKRLEYQLAETAARLDATITFLPLGFCLLSSDYRYIRINAALADINGLSVEEHLGQKVTDILPFVWKMIEPILKQIEVTLEPVLNVEVKHPSEDRTWLVSYYPVPDVDGGLLGFGSVALEITERQQALNTLRETNVKLRDLTKQQQRFVADAAHELRAPLTSIRGNLDLMTRYQEIPKEEQQEMLQDLHQETLRLSRLVEDLLELARSDSGLKMNFQTVNLTDILLEVWDKVQQFNTSHTFELNDMAQVFISGDADRLKQLVLIFLENAAKYTPDGETICMGLTRDETSATFRIQDTGIGIAREDLEHVFERFYRADKARTRAEDPGGTGLGLSIAEWIVTGHKGKVWLESELGQGTTVFVQLPL